MAVLVALQVEVLLMLEEELVSVAWHLLRNIALEALEVLHILAAAD